MKKMLILFLTVIMMVGIVGIRLQCSIYADDIKQFEGFEYIEEGNTITITKYLVGQIKSQKVSETTVIIPSEINGKSVTKIGDHAFSNCTFVPEIIIPNSVTSIGNYSFAYCNSLQLSIPDSVIYIGDGAFAGCDHLSQIKISSNVISIGTEAFYGHYLNEIHVDSQNPNYSSGGGVLFNKDKTTLIKCPDNKKGTYTVPARVINIGQRAFANCEGLTSIIITNGATSIEPNAFDGCYKSLLTLYAYPGSNALSFAKQNNYKYVIILQDDFETLPWATQSIKDVIGDGIMSCSVDANGELSFNPTAAITRAEFATVLFNYLNITRDYIKNFDDTSNHWARGIVSALVTKGILTGYSDTVFAPDEPITREQIAVVLNRGLKPNEAVMNFKYTDDITISDWAKDSVYIIHAAGWMDGDEEDAFNPANTATRAEIATIFSRLSNK